MLLTVLLSPSFGTESYQYFWTGNDLVKYMREYEKVVNSDPDENLYEASMFHGYILGVWDVTNSSYNKPKGTNSKQVCAIVAKFLKEHPEKWHLSASDLIIMAFVKAFGYSKN